jgi:hypothetical protein
VEHRWSICGIAGRRRPLQHETFYAMRAICPVADDEEGELLEGGLRGRLVKRKEHATEEEGVLSRCWVGAEQSGPGEIRGVAL